MGGLAYGFWPTAAASANVSIKEVPSYSNSSKQKRRGDATGGGGILRHSQQVGDGGCEETASLSTIALLGLPSFPHHASTPGTWYLTASHTTGPQPQPKMTP